MKSLLFCIALMLIPSMVHAQEFEIVTHEQHEYVLEEDGIQFGSVGLLARSLFTEAENDQEYDSFNREEFNENSWGLNNDDDLYTSRQEERYSSWENRRSRDRIKNNIIDRIPNMCLILPNLDGGLVGGCLYHFNPRPSYVRFE